MPATAVRRRAYRASAACLPPILATLLVWAASYQRSGNTLTLRTLHDVYGIDRFCTVHGGGPWMRGRARSRNYKVPEELVGLPTDELFDALRDRPEPFFVKSHRIQDSADPAPALYIVRDGRDVHVSRAHWIAGKKVGPYELPYEERLDTLVTSGHPPWSEHIHRWRTRSGPTALVRFEELVDDPAGTVKRACDELGVPLPEPVGELTPWEKLQARNPLMHRRGKAGSWQEEMPPEIEERFWSIHGEEMDALGYSRRDGSATETAGASAR